MMWKIKCEMEFLGRGRKVKKKILILRFIRGEIVIFLYSSRNNRDCLFVCLETINCKFWLCFLHFFIQYIRVLCCIVCTYYNSILLRKWKRPQLHGFFTYLDLVVAPFLQLRHLVALEWTHAIDMCSCIPSVTERKEKLEKKIEYKKIVLPSQRKKLLCDSY